MSGHFGLLAGEGYFFGNFYLPIYHGLLIFCSLFVCLESSMFKIDANFRTLLIKLETVLHKLVHFSNFSRICSLICTKSFNFMSIIILCHQRRLCSSLVQCEILFRIVTGTI